MQRPTLIISSAARSPYRAPAPNADSPCTSIKVRTPSASTHACAKPREAAIGAASKAIRLAPGSIIKLNRTFGHQDCRSDRHRRDALRQLHACGRRPPLPSNAALARGGAARSAHCGKQRTALRVRPGQRRPPAQQRGAHARSRTAPSSALYPASSPGSAGARPRSVSTRCAQPKPEKTTAFTPWPGNVLSPTQYRPCAPPEARQATDTRLCSQGARRAVWLDMIQGATSPRTKQTPTRAASAADAFAHAWQPSGAQGASGHGQAPVRQADRAVRLLCRRGPGAVHRGVCAHPAGVRLDTVQGATGPRATHGDTRRQCCRCVSCRHARSRQAGPAARLDGGAVEGHAEHAERPPRGDGPVRAVAPVQEAAVRARRAHLPPGCAGVGRRAAPCPCPAAGQPTLLIALRMSPARRRDT